MKYNSLGKLVNIWLSGEIIYVNTLFQRVLQALPPIAFEPVTSGVLVHCDNGIHSLSLPDSGRNKRTPHKSKKTPLVITQDNEHFEVYPTAEAYIRANRILGEKRKNITYFLGMLNAAPDKNRWAIQQLPPAFKEVVIPENVFLNPEPATPTPWQEENIALILAQPALDLLGVY